MENINIVDRFLPIQGELARAYKEQRHRYKLAKNRAEKERVKVKELLKLDKN